MNREGARVLRARVRRPATEADTITPRSGVLCEPVHQGCTALSEHALLRGHADCLAATTVPSPGTVARSITTCSYP